MRYFYLSEGGNNEIRLTFSNLSLPEIDLGISKLAAYLKERCMSADVILAAEIEASPINN
jgi:DNA-binding transcriptional MocR family regulator